MARTKQTARKSTGGKVNHKQDLYKYARKEHLEKLENLSLRSSMLLEEAGAVAYKDEQVYYKDASPEEVEKLTTHLISIRDSLDSTLDHITKIGTFRAPVITKRLKRSYFSGHDSHNRGDDNQRPTKRSRLNDE